MEPSVLPRESVARHLSISTTLARSESRRLIRVVRRGEPDGYGPAEICIIRTILTDRRDLEINLAGV